MAFNSNHDLINVKNGLLNVKTGQFLPHSPEIPFTNQMSVIYDRTAKAEKFEQFMKQILPEKEQTTVYEMFAAPLIHNLDLGKIMICVGEDPGGKSTLFGVMGEIYGDDCIHVPINEMMAFHSLLLQKKLNISDDIHITKKDLKLLRNLITKKDMGDTCKMARLFFSCNVIDWKGGEEDIFRRIDFDVSFTSGTENPNLLDELTEEKSGILNILLSHARTLQENGRLTHSYGKKSDRQMGNSSKTDVDDAVVDFANAYIIQSDDGMEPKDGMYEKFAIFCKQNNIHPMSQWYFSKKLAKLGYKWKKKRFDGLPQNVWLDVKLKSSL